jgi:protein associated with RNAse G/E
MIKSKKYLVIAHTTNTNATEEDRKQYDIREPNII